MTDLSINMIKAFIVTAFCLCSILTKAEIPILAYGGIPDSYSNSQRYKEFKEAGFDICIESYGGIPLNRLVKKLNDAQSANIKLILASNLFKTAPQEAISQLKGHPALYGYYLYDEPKPTDLEMIANVHKSIRRIDTVTPCYMNLLPDYGPQSRQNHGITSYQDYIRQASSLGLQQLSFDHYPITTTGIRKTWFENLEIIRDESVRTKKPFWAFVLCTPHYIYPQPTLGSLRLQIYSNLAYGAKGIQYFTYWTPAPYGNYDFHDGPIDRDGKKTVTYSLVKEMNAELRSILPLFDNSEVLSVGHLLDIPEGCQRATTLPKKVTRLKVKGKCGALVSILRNDGHDYLAVVNKDFENPLQLQIKVSKSVVRITKELKEEAVKTAYTIQEGDIMLFRLT